MLDGSWRMVAVCFVILYGIVTGECRWPMKTHSSAKWSCRLRGVEGLLLFSRSHGLFGKRHCRQSSVMILTRKSSDMMVTYTEQHIQVSAEKKNDSPIIRMPFRQKSDHMETKTAHVAQ